MAEGARVESIDAIKAFRVAMFKFQETCGRSLEDVESEMHQKLNWLENEQTTYWQGQIRKRHEAHERAKEALRMKKIFKDSSGRTPSAVDEEKAVRVAQQKLEEAQQKHLNCKRYSRLLQREIQTYHGTVQRFATSLQSDIPMAAAALDGMTSLLEQYVSLAPADSGSINLPDAPGSGAAPGSLPPTSAGEGA